MDTKKIIIFVVVVVLIAILLWPSKGFTIRNVEDGNTLVLANGVIVKLIGVNSTQEGQQELENLVGKKVELVPDENSPFLLDHLEENSMVYAYVLLPDYNYECVNSTLLKFGYSTLVENCKDSLYAFRKYAKKGEEVVPQPPTPTPIPEIVYSDDDIKLPPYQMPSERKHSTWYVDGQMNLSMIEEACDYNLPYTKSFANQLAGRSEGNFNPGQICEIFKYCYTKWRYVNDPNGQEYVARASETIASYLTGDCDDFSVLMASCLLAVGADVCINTGHNERGGHAFTEVDISRFDYNDVLSTIQAKFNGYSIENLHVRRCDSKVWLNLDWQAAYPGGKYYDCRLSHDTYPCVNGRWTWNKIR